MSTIEFEAHLKRTEARIRAYIHRFASDSDGDDVFQEAMTRIWERQYPLECFEAFALTCVKSILWDRARQRWRRRTDSIEALLK